MMTFTKKRVSIIRSLIFLVMVQAAIVVYATSQVKKEKNPGERNLSWYHLLDGH